MSLAESARDALSGISSMAMRALLTELVDMYQRETGARVAIQSVGGVEAAQRVLDGEPFDVVVLAADALARLAAAGWVDAATRVDLVRSDIAIAVCAGAALPDIRNEEGVRATVSRARSIGYSTGPSGVHVQRLLQRWGVVDGAATRVVQAPPGVPVGTLIARGEVEIGFQQFSELMNVDGVTIVGPMPPAIQATTVFSAAIGLNAQRREAAHAFLNWLALSYLGDVTRRHGMTSCAASIR